VDETEIDLRAILGVLRRRARLIAATFVVVVGAAALVALALTPKFTASALVQYDPAARSMIDPGSQTAAGADSARVDGEVEIIRSDAVLLDAIESADLIRHEEFGVSIDLIDRVLAQFGIAEPEVLSGDAALTDVLGNVRDALSVSRRGLTYLINVGVTAQSPESAANLANAVARSYVDVNVRNKIDSALAARDVLRSRLETTSSSIVQAEQAFDAFIGDNLDTITRETGRQDIAALQAELDRLVDQRRENSSISAAVSGDIESGDWLSVASRLQDEAVAELARQREDISRRLSAASSGSDAAIDLQAELEQLDTELRARTEDELSDLRQTVSDQQAAAGEVRDDLRSAVVSSDLPADLLTRIYGIQQNAEVARSQYQSLLTRLRDLEAQAQTQLADSRIVSPALAPTDPSFPNTRLILALAGISALGLGVGLAFLYENYVGGFVSEEQVENVVTMPVVSVVPKADTPRLANQVDSAAQLMVEKPLSAFAESIRRLRAALDQTLDLRPHGAPGKTETDAHGKAIMVTSAVPGEGKSTVAVSLGRAYAQSGLKVVMIDCDLRKPSLHRYMEQTLNAGLAEYLSGSNEDADALARIMVKDKHTPLYAIVGSQHSQSPTDQLASGQPLSRLICACREHFDVVILDTPPLVPVVDGLYMSRLVDAIVIVIRWATTSQPEVRNAVRSISQSAGEETPVLGVLNQEQSSQRQYDYKYGGYYSG